MVTYQRRFYVFFAGVRHSKPRHPDLDPDPDPNFYVNFGCGSATLVIVSFLSLLFLWHEVTVPEGFKVFLFCIFQSQYGEQQPAVRLSPEQYRKRK
jgi:hypothetical protein